MIDEVNEFEGMQIKCIECNSSEDVQIISAERDLEKFVLDEKKEQLDNVHLDEKSLAVVMCYSCENIICTLEKSE